MGDSAQGGYGQQYAGAYQGGWQQGAQQAQTGSFPPFNPGEPVSIPGIAEGTYSFGGWSGHHPYYIANATGQSVWAAELHPPNPRPDAKQIGAAIAAAATQRRYMEQQQRQWHEHQQYWASYNASYAGGQWQGDGQSAATWDGQAHQNVEAAASTEGEGGRKRAAEEAAGGHAGEATAADNGAAAGAAENGSGEAEEGGEGAKRQKTSEEGGSDGSNGVAGTEAAAGSRGEEGAETKEDQRVKGGGETEEEAGLPEGGDCGEGRVGTVLVWDLDETLIVFNSLLTGSFSGLKEGMTGENAKSLASFAEQLETLVYAVAENSFFFNSLEGNYWNLWAATEGDDGRDLSGYEFEKDGLTGRQNEGGGMEEEAAGERGRSALRFRIVRERFEKARQSDGGLKEILGEQQREGAQAWIEAIDALTDKWLSTAEEVLSSVWQFDTVVDSLAHATPPLRRAQHCEELRRRAMEGSFRFEDKSGAAGGGGARTHVNVLVTNGELVPTLAKLLLFNLHKFFHPSCIMSSREVGKGVCFAEVVRRFRGAQRIVAIGDSREEEGAATRCGFSGFVKVTCPGDLRTVQQYLQ